MDTETKWKEMESHLDDGVKPDYFRFNVSLKGVRSAIDNVDDMEKYRNLVILQPGSARMAREVATALLLSRFYFVLDAIPNEVAAPNLYHGAIRCKGPIKEVLGALQHLHPSNLNFVTDLGPLSRFGGKDDVCPTCESYYRPVSILLHHRDDIVNIYIRLNRKKRWRISGFPSTMA